MVAITMLNSSTPFILRFSNSASVDVTEVTRESDVEVSELHIQYVIRDCKYCKLTCS